MRFTLLLTVATGALAIGVPNCALPCLAEASPKLGCGTEDIACQCSKGGELLNAVKSCVMDKCGPSKSIQAQQAYRRLCKKQKKDAKLAEGK